MSVLVLVRSVWRFYRVLDWALHQKSLLTLLWRRLRLHPGARPKVVELPG
jgi:hypothetical protein